MVMCISKLKSKKKSNPHSNSNDGIKQGDDTNIIVKTTLKNNQYPIKSYESICLLISSCFFLGPGIYAYYSEFYFYFIISTITSIVSANYWRYAVIKDWRLTADLIVAKVSFVIYFISGCIFFHGNLYLLSIAVPGCLLIIVFYFLSKHFWNVDSIFWIYFHVLFHLFVALEQYLVVYGSVLFFAK